MSADKKEIIEKINGFFGYNCISQVTLKIAQNSIKSNNKVFPKIKNISKIDKFFKYLIYPSIFLIFCARIVLVEDNFSEKLSLKRNFINMDNWSNELDSIAKGNDILFTNKYQKFVGGICWLYHILDTNLYL